MGIIIIIYLVACVAVGILGARTVMGFAEALLLSVIFTPILVLFLVLSMDKADSKFKF